MTDEEIRECAKEVLANKTRSHVRAAAELAQWVTARLEKEAAEKAARPQDTAYLTAAQTFLARGKVNDIEVANILERWCKIGQATSAEDTAQLRKAQEMVKRYIVAQGPHLYESWREALIKDCGLVEDELGFVTVPEKSA